MLSEFEHSEVGNTDRSQLWQGLRDGDREALNTLFRIYYGSLLNYGVKLVQKRPLVKDAIQKLFLKLWRTRDDLSTPDTVKSYLFVSFRRILLSKVKRKNARDERDQSYMDSVFRDPTNIEDDIIAGEIKVHRKQILARAMQELSPRQKEALYLRFYDGLTNKEIAEVMDIAYQTVRNHISEGIQKIKRHTPSPYSFPEMQSEKAYKRVESM